MDNNTMFDNGLNESADQGRKERRSESTSKVTDVTDLLTGYSKGKRNSKELTEYLKVMKEILAEYAGHTLHHFKKGYKGLSYDTILLCRDTDDGLLVFSSVVAETGVEYMFASDIADIISGDVKGGIIDLPGTAINENFFNALSSDITAIAKDEDVYAIEGLISSDLTEDGARDVINAFLKAADTEEVVIPNDMFMNSLTANETLNTKLIVEEINGSLALAPGDIRRCNASVTTILSTEEKSRLSNSGGVNATLASVGLFVTPVPAEGERKGEVVLIPEVTISMIESPAASIIPVIASIFNATAMSSDRTWLRVLTNDVLSGKDLGAMNTILTDKEGPLPRITFGKKDSVSDITDTLSDMIDDTPAYSMICKPYMVGGNDVSLFSALADGNLAAGGLIIDALVEMSDGAFDADFNPKNIIENSVLIYGGTYPSNKGEPLPLEQIDIPEVLSRSLDDKSIPMQVINDFILAFGGADEDDVKKLMSYDLLGIKASINTQCIKITFGNDFIDEMIESLEGTIFDGKSDRYFGVDIDSKHIRIDGIAGKFRSAATSRKRHVTSRGNSRRNGRIDYGVRSRY